MSTARWQLYSTPPSLVCQLKRTSFLIIFLVYL
nr:MAG TPA: hypothetical protein [Caudoviricetes sp.]